MSGEPILKTKPSTGLAIFFGLGGLMFCWPAVLFGPQAFKDGYLQLAPAIMATFFGAFSATFFIGAYFLGAIAVYSDRIISYSILGNIIKTIYLREIASWEEVESEDKKQRHIIIRAAKRKLSISHLEQGYAEVKEHLSHLERGEYFIMDNSALAQTRQKRKANRLSYIMGCILLALSCLMVYSGLIGYFYPEKEFENLHLSEVSGVAAATPEVYKGSGSSKWIRLKLTNHPKYTFEISGVAFSATAPVDEIKAGDSVFIGIKTSEYRKKITHEQPMTFWDKTDLPDKIGIYELWDNEYLYLSLENYKRANEADGQLGIFIAAIGLGLIMWTVWQFHKLRAKETIS